jgi:hypothetical protein
VDNKIKRALIQFKMSPVAYFDEQGGNIDARQRKGKLARQSLARNEPRVGGLD